MRLLKSDLGEKKKLDHNTIKQLLKTLAVKQFFLFGS